MHVEGRIETIEFQETFCLYITFGLDTAKEHRLLDQRFGLKKLSGVYFSLDILHHGITATVNQNHVARNKAGQRTAQEGT